MTPDLLLAGVLVLLAGLAIGATSIGGVLVVPALTLVAVARLGAALAGRAAPPAVRRFTALVLVLTGLWYLAR